jgi:Na+-driven multidrug efflux pump
VMMLVLVAGAQLAPEAMMRLFSSDTKVIGIGAEYLRIISWSFVASGITYVTSSMFQALGKTVSSLVAAATRMAVIVGVLLTLSMTPAFSLSWIWYVLAGAIVCQTVVSTLLLRRQFRARFAGAPAVVASASALTVAPSHPAR